MLSISLNELNLLPFAVFSLASGRAGEGLDSCFWQCPGYLSFFKPGVSVTSHFLGHDLTSRHFFEPLKCPLCKISMPLALFGLDFPASGIPAHFLMSQPSTHFLSASGQLVLALLEMGICDGLIHVSLSASAIRENLSGEVIVI